jgi:hypothetical protein
MCRLRPSCRLRRAMTRNRRPHSTTFAVVGARSLSRLACGAHTLKKLSINFAGSIESFHQKRRAKKRQRASGQGYLKT